jgi:cell division protein FtsZ
MEERNFYFDLPAHGSSNKSIIKVVGVGGGGSNAVNYMHNQGIEGVEFIVCNTDSQALKISKVENQIQLGTSLLGGLGAGAIPENGREAAILSEEEIRERLADGTRMIFITAGMGGGTGTGAAPVIARIAKELGILTIGIVTRPFKFEGPRKNAAAERGIQEMRQYCDTVIEILNDKIRELYSNMSMNQAFAQADHVLCASAKSISEIITIPGLINVDFKDIETTMKDSGTAVMGSASAKGDDRAMKAVSAALSSPLLNNNEIEGATKVLLAITYGHAPELTMDEFYQITEYIKLQTGEGAEVIFGTTMDADLGDAIQVTVVATGFHKEHAHGHGSSQHPQQVHVLTDRPGVDTHFGHPAVQAPAPQPAAPEYNPYAQPARPAYTPPVQQPYQAPVAPQAFEANVPPQPAPQPVPVPVAAVPPVQPSAPVPPAEPQKPVAPQGEEFQVVDINGNFQLMYQSPENVDRPLENVAEILSKQPDFANRINRAEVLRSLSANAIPRPNYDDPDYLKQNEQPAYLRRGNNMNPTPAGQENMSRYTLNDNNEILDNNKYFNPKVD